MPLSKEDSRKAVGLLEEFCGKLQETNEEEHAATLRYTIQLMQSELFQQLIDIQTDYHQEVQQKVRPGELQLSQDPTAASDFCHRYGISTTSLDALKGIDIDSGIVNGGTPTSGNSPTVKEDKDRELVQDPMVGYDDVGSTLFDMSLEETWELLSPDPILARANDLLRDDATDEKDDVVAPLKTSTPMVGQSAPLMTELIQRTAQRRQSLDEMDAAKDSIVNSRANKYRVSRNGEIHSERQPIESNGRKDALYFMRHQESLAEIQKSLHGREHRIARFTKGPVGVGLSIVGMAHTGVFIKEIIEGGPAQVEGTLIKGDQILEINGRNAGIDIL